MHRKQYVPGDNYVIDDITGLKIRASEAQRQWDGFVTNKADHSPRHPQEFVRGLADVQRPVLVRPQAVPVIGGPFQTTTTAAAGVGALAVSVLSADLISTGDNLSVMMANAEVFRTEVDFVQGNMVHLAAPLPYRVDAGASVIDNSAMSEPSY